MATASADDVRFIPLSYNNAESQSSALRLVLALYPEWKQSEGPIEFVRFTDGITNTLLKAIKKRPGLTETQIDDDAVLLRAYGNNTDVLIDRERETTSHSLLSRHNLAPTLLARFQNGLLYKFIQGKVCTPADLTRESVWRGVARRLGEWHSILPITTVHEIAAVEEDKGDIPLPLSRPASSRRESAKLEAIRKITPGKAVPNTWTVMQKWIFALPAETETERKRRDLLQQELYKLVKELGDKPGLGKNGLVFGHCDLLSGNVIMEPGHGAAVGEDVETVSFIDYEYATPSPAAFDIANHFAEWGGFDCDYNKLPTRSVRRHFLQDYLQSYHSHQGQTSVDEKEVQRLFDEVEDFRGVPGFYWGIWALIQATISQIDFDYADYAEVRLGEYWAWRAENDGSREKEGKEMPLRERRWAQEV
ncbi:MAG: hypothetical protein M1819_000036 [Sarea resinae]|nr:MAG: hypothetical protein M1819_000036 [Sarea resinae]